MITPDRFLARSCERTSWMLAREQGVTATTVAKAATPAGFTDVVENRSVPVEDNPYMAWGRLMEPLLMRHVHATHGILPNDWLIAGERAVHLATPDGLSLDHALIAEVKTTGKDWSTPPIQYRRQVQWQLHVTGADRCLFAWLLRATDDWGGFYTPWMDPKTLWIERDDDMIADLVQVADRLMEVA